MLMGNDSCQPKVIERVLWAGGLESQPLAKGMSTEAYFQ